MKPDKLKEKNPDVIERFRTATSRICTKAKGPFGQRFVYSARENRQLNKSIRSLPTKNGMPLRSSKHAHATDAFTYPINRYFPRRRATSGMPEVEILSRFEGVKRVGSW